MLSLLSGKQHIFRFHNGPASEFQIRRGTYCGHALTAAAGLNVVGTRFSWLLRAIHHPYAIDRRLGKKHIHGKHLCSAALYRRYKRHKLREATANPSHFTLCPIQLAWSGKLVTWGEGLSLWERIWPPMSMSELPTIPASSTAMKSTLLHRQTDQSRFHANISNQL
jgi:hypothetical protein